MARREWVIGEMANERREARNSFRPWTHREKVVDNPINSKSSEHMPKKIKSNMFYAIFFFFASIRPESYQK
jgi:hypothetical protein